MDAHVIPPRVQCRTGAQKWGNARHQRLPVVDKPPGQHRITGYCIAGGARQATLRNKQGRADNQPMRARRGRASATPRRTEGKGRIVGGYQARESEREGEYQSMEGLEV